MRTLLGRNVNELYAKGIALLGSEGVGEDTRNGRAVVMPCPVVSVYERPCERVLFDVARDANPFFHLMEGLWMLAGRDDVGFLNNYVADFGARYGDNGVIHGAYGHRWRKALGFDQIDEIVRKLRANPNDRQCVLQMWDASMQVDGCNDLEGVWKDRPCNTHVYFRVRMQDADEQHAAAGCEPFPVLEMTILCRSNDIVWGAYGANAVHFSMMMEYVAGRIGVGVGTMYQFSNNWHGYVQTLDKVAPIEPPPRDLYALQAVAAMPMADDWSTWDVDLQKFMRWHNWLYDQTSEFTDISVGVENTAKNQWFRTVAVPVAQTNWLRRRGRMHDALVVVDQISADDWHQACREWLVRRQEKAK